jgi:hypothetical protein
MEYIPRKIQGKLDKWLGRKEAILIKGPRQAGKTTLLKHYQEKLDCGYVSLDDTELREAIDKNPIAFAKRFARGGYLLIDEAQYVKDVGLRIKQIYDTLGIKIIATGSGSFDIKEQIGKYMVGRAFYLELYPLSFEEFIHYKANELYGAFTSFSRELIRFVEEGRHMKAEPVFEREFYDLLNEYVVYGGFPAVVKEGSEEAKRDVLKNLATTYLEKDVSFFFDVRQSEKFSDFLKYLSFNNSGMINAADAGRELGIDYRTLWSYISIMTNTYIISLLQPFHTNESTELKKEKKVYFVDTGLRNSLLNNYLPVESRNDKGALLENFVLRELYSNFSESKIHYWRTTTKAEVDFVLEQKDKILPIESKSSGTVSRSLMSFLDKYKPERALIFGKRGIGISKRDGTDLANVPYFFV